MDNLRTYKYSKVTIFFFITILLFGGFQGFSMSLANVQSQTINEIVEIVEVEEEQENEDNSLDKFIQSSIESSNKYYSFYRNDTQKQLNYHYPLFEITIPPPEFYL